MTPVAERFWNKVLKGAANDCWPWTAATNNKGYGRFMLARKSRGAHKVAYELSHGQVPSGLWVLHTCDNPPCCNPQHLYAGTASDNLNDAYSRGRKFVAYNTNRAKITRNDALAIRASALSNKELAAIHGITADNVRRIKKGELWP